MPRNTPSRRSPRPKENVGTWTRGGSTPNTNQPIDTFAARVVSADLQSSTTDCCTPSSDCDAGCGSSD